MRSKSRSLVAVTALGCFGMLASVVLPSVAQAATLGTDLVLYHDYDGDLLDNSGHGNNGTGMTYDYSSGSFGNGGVFQNSNTATISYGAGKVGQAAWINSDGVTPGNSNYITLGNHLTNPDLNFGNTVDTQNPNPPLPTDFSISMWVKTNHPTGGGDANFFSNKYGGGSSSDGTGYLFRRQNSNLLNAAMIYDDGDPMLANPAVNFGGAGPNLGNDAWHHIGMTFDRDGRARTFIDGNTNPVTSVNMTQLLVLTLNPTDTNFRINIGQDGSGGYANKFVNGMLVDELAIWRGKLNSLDFKSIYDAGVAGTPAALSTLLGNNLAPEDFAPPDVFFNWNYNAYPTGDFGAVGTPGNTTWLNELLAPKNPPAAPQDPDGTGITLHVVNIDNATVTVTDARLVSSLVMGTIAGDVSTLIVANGASLTGTAVGSINAGQAGNGTIIVNGTGIMKVSGAFELRVGAGAGGTGLIEQNDTSYVEVGDWVAAPNDFGFTQVGNARLVVGAAANAVAEYRISDNALLRGGRDIRVATAAGSNATMIMEGNSTIQIREGFRFGDSTQAAGSTTVNATIKDNSTLSAIFGVSMLDGRQLASNHTFNIQGNAVVNAGVSFIVGETITGPADGTAGHGTATLNQSGGTINIGTLKNDSGGYQDSAEFILSQGNPGGTNGGIKANGGSIDGRYNLSGGVLNSARFAIVGVNFDGVVNHTGGTANFKSGEFDSGTSTWSGGKAISATFADSGGHLSIGGTDGTGANQVPRTTIPSADALGNGIYNISGSAVMNVEGTMTVARHGEGTFKVTGGNAVINVGTGYTIDTAWTATGATPRVVPQGVFRVQDGSFTLGNSTGAGKLITEVTTTGVSPINVHGNVTIGPLSTYQVVATSVPAFGAYAWDVLVADSDADGIYSGGPAATFTGSFTTKTIPAGLLTLDRKLRYLVEGENKRIVLGLSHDGDVNFDGVVDIFDINAVSASWHPTVGGANDRADANGDDAVDIFDINMISQYWDNNVNPPAVPVPEPSTFVMAGLGIVGLLAAGWRKRGRG